LWKLLTVHWYYCSHFQKAHMRSHFCTYTLKHEVIQAKNIKFVTVVEMNLNLNFLLKVQRNGRVLGNGYGRVRKWKTNCKNKSKFWSHSVQIQNNSWLGLWVGVGFWWLEGSGCGCGKGDSQQEELNYSITKLRCDVTSCFFFLNSVHMIVCIVVLQQDRASGMHTRSILCKPVRNRDVQIIGKEQEFWQICFCCCCGNYIEKGQHRSSCTN
jgi:hypothetical protein